MTSQGGVGRITGDRSVLVTGVGNMKDARTGAKIRDVPGATRCFTADGSSIVSSTGRVYDIDSTEVWHKLWPDQSTLGESFAGIADGQLLARPGIVWAMARPVPYHHLHDRAFGAFSFSPDGELLLPAAAVDRTGLQGLESLNIYSCATGATVGSISLKGERLIHACFSPKNAEHVAWASIGPDAGKGSVHYVDWKSGEALRESIALPAESRWIAFHPSAEWLAVLCTNRQVLRVDLASGEIQTLFEIEADDYTYGEPRVVAGRLEFLDGGNNLAAWGLEAGFHMWDVGEGKIRYKFLDDVYRQRLVHAGDVMFSTAFYENEINPFFDRQTGAPLPHNIPAGALARSSGNDLSPDGNLVLWAGSRTRQVQLFDRLSGEKPIRAIRVNENTGPYGALIPEHHALAVWGVVGIGQRGDEIGFYDRRDGKPLCPNVIVGLKMTELKMSPGGKYLVGTLAYPDQNVGVFDLEAWFSEGKHAGLSSEDRMLLAEINSQARIVDGHLEHVSIDEWDKRWKEFRQRHPDYHQLELGAEEMKRWHSNNAARPFARKEPREWHRKRLEGAGE